MEVGGLVWRQAQRHFAGAAVLADGLGRDRLIARIELGLAEHNSPVVDRRPGDGRLVEAIAPSSG